MHQDAHHLFKLLQLVIQDVVLQVLQHVHQSVPQSLNLLLSAPQVVAQSQLLHVLQDALLPKLQLLQYAHQDVELQGLQNAPRNVPQLLLQLVLPDVE